MQCPVHHGAGKAAATRLKTAATLFSRVQAQAESSTGKCIQVGSPAYLRCKCYITFHAEYGHGHHANQASVAEARLVCARAVNDGGLVMLNQILLESAAPQIRAALRVRAANLFRWVVMLNVW